MVEMLDVIKVMVRCMARDERGATAVEYALMCVLIAVVIFASVDLIGSALQAVFGDANLNGAIN